jgi:hypothetical protein
MTMKIYKNGELLVTTNSLMTFDINHDTDVVTFQGGSVIGRKGSPTWKIELNPNEVGILHHELDRRRAKIRKAYEALTSEQQKRFSELMFGAMGSDAGTGLGVQEKFIAKIKAETEGSA